MTTTITLKSYAQIVADVKEFFKNVSINCPDSHQEKLLNSFNKVSEDFSTHKNLVYVLSNYPDVGFKIDHDVRVKFQDDNIAMLFSHIYKANNKKFKQSEEIVVSMEPCPNNTVIVWCDEPMVVKVAKSGKVTTETICGETYYENFGFGIDNEPHYIIGTK